MLCKSNCEIPHVSWYCLATFYRDNAFKKWQEYANDEAFVIPTLYRQQIFPVNKRVKNASVDYASSQNLNWAKIAVTSNTTAKD